MANRKSFTARIVKRELADGTIKEFSYRTYRTRFTFKSKRYAVFARTIAELKLAKENKLEELKSASNLNAEYLKKTYKEITNEFLNSAQHLTTGSQKRRTSIWNKWILPYFGNDVVYHTDKHELNAFFNWVRDEANEQGFAGPKTAHQVYNVLNVFFNWNVEMDKCVTENPIVRGLTKSIKTAVTTYVDENVKDKHIIESEVIRVMEFVEGKQEEIIYHLQTYHGLRISEALGIQWSHIDFSRNLIKVRQQVEVGGTIKKDLKSHHNREIPISPDTRDLLLNTPEDERQGFLYADANGIPLDKDKWRRKHRRNLFQLGLVKNKKITNAEDSILAETHSFRKFFASYNLKQNNDVAKISRWLGHRKQKTTLEHYSLVIYDDESLVQTNNLMSGFTKRKNKTSQSSTSSRLLAL